MAFRAVTIRALITLNCSNWYVPILTKREIGQLVPHGPAVGIDMGVAPLRGVIGWLIHRAGRVVAQARAAARKVSAPDGPQGEGLGELEESEGTYSAHLDASVVQVRPM